MFVKYHTCDHCGKKLNEMNDYPEMDFGFTYGITADLCAECVGELNKKIKKFVGKEEKEREDAEIH